MNPHTYRPVRPNSAVSSRTFKRDGHDAPGLRLAAWPPACVIGQGWALNERILYLTLSHMKVIHTTGAFDKSTQSRDIKAALEIARQL